MVDGSLFVWLWCRIPGRLWVRLFVVLSLLVFVVGVCFVWVFPWVDGWLGLEDVTVQ